MKLTRESYTISRGTLKKVLTTLEGKLVRPVAHDSDQNKDVIAALTALTLDIEGVKREPVPFVRAKVVKIPRDKSGAPLNPIMRIVPMKEHPEVQITLRRLGLDDASLARLRKRLRDKPHTKGTPN